MIAVTGIGVVSPHGSDAEAMFAALLRGESAVSEFAAATAGKPAPVAVAPFDVAPWFTPLQLVGVDRVSQLAVAAAQRAWDDAQAAGACEPIRIGIYAGCGMGGGGSLEAAYVSGLINGRAPPLTVPAFMPNAPASHIAMRLKITGPVLTYSIACASSAVAIGEAAKAIRAGEVDLAIAGGSEALIAPGIVKAWQALQTLATFAPEQAAGACRPFALDRNGFALGEGAAFMILESAERARARGARCYAELAGCGMSCDATHLTKPDANGQRNAIAAALQQADLTPRDVGYCNAHGTATKIGDVVESDALNTVWGEDIADLRVSSTKSMHGHLLGATGALEAVITVLALHHRQLPPNINCDQPDPACRLNLVRSINEAAPKLEAAISSSFAFGGSNAVLAFRRT
ncbi:beta-ketoacyl-[acyl-carrier-protein] synthase family protein [Azonexus sp.]|uniref:beta-ketoacyl-[acyl-carrier-protein] synthase family protein n=1 Tax=Azonexus sp. TaxID=1872668 RepID=UPI0028288726|nr:beta-ketoacyl-[acyl-carrier-protein] synthase family protein [Azonexus sp.]MDR1995395.1 beta-ketoacyl-[acyl-carrier-protein] synthase family protein [Azonexus sp.]